MLESQQITDSPEIYKRWKFKMLLKYLKVWKWLWISRKIWSVSPKTFQWTNAWQHFERDTTISHRVFWNNNFQNVADFPFIFSLTENWIYVSKKPLLAGAGHLVLEKSVLKHWIFWIEIKVTFPSYQTRSDYRFDVPRVLRRPVF